MANSLPTAPSSSTSTPIIIPSTQLNPPVDSKTSSPKKNLFGVNPQLNATLEKTSSLACNIAATPATSVSTTSLNLAPRPSSPVSIPVLQVDQNGWAIIMHIDQQKIAPL